MASTPGPKATRPALKWLIVACVFSQFIHTVYGSVVNIALPEISSQLHAGIASLQWVVSAYVLALASLLIFAGTLADRFGRKRVLIIGNLIMIGGAVISALAPSVMILTLGRFTQGIGSALMAPAGLSILSVAAPNSNRRALEVVWWTAVGTVTLAAGPILGGLLMQQFGWRSLFWAGIPLGLVAIALASFIVTESKDPEPQPFDLAGLVLLTLFLAGLAFLMFEGATLGWTSAPVLAAGAVVVIVAVTFHPVEKDHPAPVVPTRLLKNAQFTKALATAVLGFLTLAGLLFLNTFYLQSARGLSAWVAGLMTLPLALGATGTALISGRLVVEGKSRLILRAAGVLTLVGALSLWATQGLSVWWTVLPYLLFGAGFGFIADPISVTALESLPAEEASLASSFISTSKQVGQMLGVGGVGLLLGAHGSHAQLFHQHGWWAWLLLAAGGLGIFLLNWEGRTAQPQGAR